ncbi:hypothetical protein [Streptomyces sp. NPDC056401]|uniref:hypothetical protein n=1 Tax=Streptomyces sp. NPDC056401 TaxID=3345809 RepID=UPI0035E023D1
MTHAPVLFIRTDQRDMPALLRFPADADPQIMTSQFPAGFFRWNEKQQCPTFDAHRVNEVVAALHRYFPSVEMRYGRSEVELERSTTVTRKPGARPSSWQQIGPRIPQGIS